jgi:hypothetical protein
VVAGNSLLKRRAAQNTTETYYVQIKKGKMNGLFRVKINRDRSLGFKYWGGMGHKGPMNWNALTGFIREVGIAQVEKIRHADKEPKNYFQLNQQELMQLWKTVDLTPLPSLAVT